MSLRVFVRAALSSAADSEFALNFRMDEQAFISIIAVGKFLAGLLRMNELALVINKFAMRPVAAPDACCLFGTTTNTGTVARCRVTLLVSLRNRSSASRSRGGVVNFTESFLSLLDQSELLVLRQVFLRLNHVFHLYWWDIDGVTQLRVRRLGVSVGPLVVALVTALLVESVALILIIKA